MLDKMIFPEIIIHSRPCSLDSKQVYDITRQYIIDNINKDIAKITSNYDFCFEVKKIIKRVEPKTYETYNIFARTKKARSKTHYKVSEYKEIQIFEMTNENEKYKGYTPISAIYANNENELKEKLDDFLEDLINFINTPIEECEHCKGTGYKQDIENLKGGN